MTTLSPTVVVLFTVFFIAEATFVNVALSPNVISVKLQPLIPPLKFSNNAPSPIVNVPLSEFPESFATMIASPFEFENVASFPMLTV